MIDYQKIESYREHVLNKVRDRADEELLQNIAWSFATAMFIADSKNYSTEDAISLCREKTKFYTDDYYGDYIDID